MDKLLQPNQHVRHTIMIDTVAETRTKLLMLAKLTISQLICMEILSPTVQMHILWLMMIRKVPLLAVHLVAVFHLITLLLSAKLDK